MSSQEREYIQYARHTTLSMKTHLLSLLVYLTRAQANITELFPVLWQKYLQDTPPIPTRLLDKSSS